MNLSVNRGYKGTDAISMHVQSLTKHEEPNTLPDSQEGKIGLQYKV